MSRSKISSVTGSEGSTDTYNDKSVNTIYDSKSNYSIQEKNGSDLQIVQSEKVNNFMTMGGL